jgi:hypothetical protein
MDTYNMRKRNKYGNQTLNVFRIGGLWKITPNDFNSMEKCRKKIHS